MVAGQTRCTGRRTSASVWAIIPPRASPIAESRRNDPPRAPCVSQTQFVWRQAVVFGARKQVRVERVRGVANVHPFDLGLRVATAHHVHGRTEEKDEPCTSGSGQDVDQSLPDHLWSQANQQPDGTRVGRYPSRRTTAQRSGHPPESSTQPVGPPNEPGASSTFGGQPLGMVAEATARGPLRDLASLFSTSDGPRNQPVRQLRPPSREMTNEFQQLE
jgi:hypothetical protein